MAGETNIGLKFYIAVGSDATVPDPQNSDLSESEYEGLTWEQIPNMGNHGDTGVDQNMISYETMDNQLTIQQKGLATGATAEVEFLDVLSDGMTAMKAAGVITDQNNYAFKSEWASGDVEYNRGVVSAPSYPKGGPEGFRRASFSIAFNQEPVFTSA